MYKYRQEARRPPIFTEIILTLFRNVAESVCYLCHVCTPVCPHVSARLPLDEFPSNVIFETLMKICREI